MTDPFEEYYEKREDTLAGMTQEQIWAACQESVIFFVYWFVEILSSTDERWIPFVLWPFQVALLKKLVDLPRVIILKARQLGFTTLVIAYLLWRMIFRPVTTVGLFSKGETEAMDLLKRLEKGYHRLPDWMTVDAQIVTNNAHLLEFSNGSWARAMSTKKGESFTFRVVFLDELDRFDNAAELIKNVKPAADAANAQMIVGSISDKDRPRSVFKSTYKAAARKLNDWYPVFVGWFARPDRDQAWYEAVVKDAISRHHGDIAAAMDEVYQQYPGKAAEALAPRKQGKRIPYLFLNRAWKERERIEPESGVPLFDGLRVYALPEPGMNYVMGADPAEGVEGGNDSACVIMCEETGEQVAAIQGKFEPKKVFPNILFLVARFYNDSSILVERNNHGHAVIGWLEHLIDITENCNVALLLDPADKRTGWLTSPSGRGITRGKVAMYDTGTQQIAENLVTICDEATLEQLADIDIQTLTASSGNDDLADAYVLACVARIIPGRRMKGKIFH